LKHLLRRYQTPLLRVPCG